MKNYKSFLVILAIALIIINAVLLAAGQKDPAVYLIVNSCVYFTLTLAHMSLNVQTKRIFTHIGTALFTGFVVVMIIKIIQIL